MINAILNSKSIQITLGKKAYLDVDICLENNYKSYFLIRKALKPYTWIVCLKTIKRKKECLQYLT